jgi:hypothetical protein
MATKASCPLEQKGQRQCDLFLAAQSNAVTESSATGAFPKSGHPIVQRNRIRALRPGRDAESSTHRMQDCAFSRNPHTR